jgi:hypothetical protein
MTPASLLLLAFVAAQSEREAEMFGDESDTAETEEKPPAETAREGPDDVQPDVGSPDEREFAPPNEGLLGAQEEALAIGGQLFLRFNGSFREDDNIGELPLSAPSLADLFADVRPNDRLRGFAQMRLTYDYTVVDGARDFLGREQQSFQILLDQLWIKFDLGRIAFITAGRQRIRWGTGRFWNPTDFINTDVRNSIDFFDQRLGVDLLKVHFPFEQLGWNLYLIGTFEGIATPLDTGETDSTLDDGPATAQPGNIGMAARAEFLFGEVEVALSTLVKKDSPLRLGLDASAAVWWFDVRGEMIVQRGLSQTRFDPNGEFDLGETPPVVPKALETDDDFFFQGVFGADLQLKYSDQDSVIIGAEYFYNQAGYPNAKLYPFLALNGAFTPLFLGQHYVAGYFVVPTPFSFNDTTFTTSTIANLSDLSALTRIDVQHSLLTYLTFNVFASYHWGNIGELHLGFEEDPAPPLLPNGISVPTQIFDAGVALRLAL